MTMADCSCWEYRISLALDGELGPADYEELAGHLDACPHCRGIRDAWEESARTLRALPDPADPALLARLKEDIRRKTARAGRRAAYFRLAWPAAVFVALFAAATIWLGPPWQRPVLVAAAVAPGNRLELTFNQAMKHWSAGAGAGTTSSMAIQPRKQGRVSNSGPVGHTPEFAPDRAVPQEKTPAPPPYTVTRRDRTLVFSFAGPLPQGPVRILVPATVRDTWGRELGRAYLVVIDHGKVTVKTI